MHVHFYLFKHINSPQHKASIHNSEFNRDILGLTKRFGNSNVKEMTISSTDTGSRDDEDSVIFMGSTGRKRVKTINE